MPAEAGMTESYNMHITHHQTPEFVDTRGAITKVLDDGKTVIKSILYITSKAGAVRSNHYHKKDAHFCFIISGTMEWHEKPVEGKGEVETAMLLPGDMVYTPPMMIHAARALEDSVFLAFATESRNRDEYEADTIRVKFIEP